jgi:long-chain acyl-CoA synthetase
MPNFPNERSRDFDHMDDIIAADQAQTLWGLFRERLRRSPNAAAYCHYDPLQDRWIDHSWAMVAERVARFRAALYKADMKPGDRVAVLLPNGIDWVCLDLAAQGSGLIIVGLYPQDMAASNARVLGHSDARLIVLDSDARWRSLCPRRAEFPALENVWICNVQTPLAAPADGPEMQGLSDVLANAVTPPAPYPAVPSDIATLIYTSGTTGQPNGVMLCHQALLWNAQATAAVIPPRQDDVFLSILPIAHAFERTVGYYLPMMGATRAHRGPSLRPLSDFPRPGLP